MEKILDRNASEQFRDDYQRYGIYITFRRVEPDYRDGFKPVQRRILWAMYHDTHAINKTVKSAGIVGDVMKKYHPHSDCISSDTMLYCLDNSYITIGEAYQRGIQKLDILAVDTFTGQIVPAVATNFRIGQYTKKKYHIVLSNGAEIKCTGNHPFLTANRVWVKAEDLKPYTRLFTECLNSDANQRPTIQNMPLYHIVHDYYFGAPPEGYTRHHKDWNPWNNTPDNLVALTRADHAMIHMSSGSAVKALEIGRKSMFDEEGKYRERIRAKNSILASEFNKDQGIRRFKYVINLMRQQGMEITEENYETFRGKVYNLPIVSRLIKRHPECGSSFEELVNYEPIPIGELFNARKNELPEIEEENKDFYKPIEFDYNSVYMMFVSMNRLVDNGIPLTVDNYIKYSQKHDVTVDKINLGINLYKLECPYVESIYIEEVQDEPMYDFTVPGFENMLIPVKSQNNLNMESMTQIWHMPFICIHNSAIYGTIKPMANWFESYIPTITPHGNFGDALGAPAAASRYTEARLSDFAIDCIFGDMKISEDSVDWSPNYDSTCVEPEYLPCKVPLLLINGSFGIGLGKRIEIPSHNTNEVIDAALALMDNPNAEIVLVPDHCQQCEIINTDFKTISRTGYGYYKVRGVVDIEEYKGKTALVIKGVPNMTFLDQVTDKIDKLIADKKIIQIDETVDKSNGKEMRYIIVLKPGADPEFVKNVIYANTELEHVERVNFEVLDGLNPIRMSYRSYLLSFLDHRRLTKFRLYTNRLQYVQTKLHEKDAYIKVLESGEIDTIINYIKKQKNNNDEPLIEYLVKKLKITDLQAKFIINSNLKSLSIGYLEKYKAEATELEKERQMLFKIITDDKYIDQEIRQELLDAKVKYGHPRNCKIIKDKKDDEIPHGMMTVIVTEKNFIKKIPEGGSTGSFKGDSIRTIIQDDNAANILIFDNMGKVFKLPIHKIPFVGGNSNGTDIRFLIKGLTANINTIIPESMLKQFADKDKTEHMFMISLTHNGLIKKMSLRDFVAVPPSGILYAKLDDNDYIVSIKIADINANMIVFNDKKAMTLPVSAISTMKRNAKGNKTFRNTYADGILELVPNKQFLLTITNQGKVNKIPLNAIPNLITPKKLFSLIKLGKGDSIQNILAVNNEDTIEIATMNGKVDISVSNIEIGSTISSGAKLLKNIRNDKIIKSYQLTQ